MKTSQPSHHIKSISVTRLFGRYTYSLPASGEDLKELNILYGENGAGKTTLLSLVFHLISPAVNKSHKTQIAQTPFQTLTVVLNDGTVLTASKDEQLLIGTTNFNIIEKNGDITSYRFNPRAESIAIDAENLPDNIDVDKLPNEIREDIKLALRKKYYFEKLSTIRISCYMLTSDRILLGDSVEDSRKRESRGDIVRNRTKLSELFIEYRSESVKEALSTASLWLQRKFLDGTYNGASASPRYEDVIKKIAKATYKTNAGLSKTEQTEVISNLERIIDDLDRKSNEFQRFGLGGRSVSPDILSSIRGSKGNRLNLINSILEPHLEGLKARLDSIDPLYELTNTFVVNINKFFRDKKLTYDVRNGFKIFVSSEGGGSQEILPIQLSSGEQQLVLLFCYVLVARDSSTIFIIDEPEISLNIVWQRMLISSLLELAKGSEIQLIFASHSMEILSKHRDRVITMEEVIVG